MALPSATALPKTKTRRGTASHRSCRPLLCSRPRPRRGIDSRRSHRPPLSPRPRPRRGIAKPRSRRPPFCPRPRRQLALQRFWQSHFYFRPDGRIAFQLRERAAVVTGSPPGVACRPPAVFPSPTSGVSASSSPRISLGLISSRVWNRSAAAAGTPRTPADYGFGRRSPATAASRPSSPPRRSPTFGSKPEASDLLPRNAVLYTAPRRLQPRPHLPPPNRTPPHHHRPPTQGPLPHPPLLYSTTSTTGAHRRAY